MNTKLSLLPLALALPMFAGCGEAADAAGGATKSAVGDLADSATGDLASKLEGFNIADMGMDEIKAQGGAALMSITERLGSIKDIADVDKLKDSMGPMLDKLMAMKDKLGESLPGTDALKAAVDGLKLKFLGNTEMLNALEPIMEKVKGLIG